MEIVKIKETIMLPTWQPLIMALGSPDSWMYMGSYALVNGVTVHTYKHSLSRDYINLSDDGRTWKYTGGSYTEINRADAIARTNEMVNSFTRQQTQGIEEMELER